MTRIRYLFSSSPLYRCKFSAFAEISPGSSMPVLENASLLFSSCHLKLVILENTLFFCLLFVQSTSSR